MPGEGPAGLKCESPVCKEKGRGRMGQLGARSLPAGLKDDGVEPQPTRAMQDTQAGERGMLAEGACIPVGDDRGSCGGGQ